VAKVDLKKELKHLYNPSAKGVSTVEVPPMNFLMIDGKGDPNTSQEYAEALEGLYTVSYAIKFIIKRTEGVDYAVMPLEGLWWTKDMREFSVDDKGSWRKAQDRHPPTLPLAARRPSIRKPDEKARPISTARRTPPAPHLPGERGRKRRSGPVAPETPRMAISSPLPPNDQRGDHVRPAG
jgi:hypothetical protein